jgi:hypothetical protein
MDETMVYDDIADTPALRPRRQREHASNEDYNRHGNALPLSTEQDYVDLDDHYVSSTTERGCCKLTHKQTVSLSLTILFGVVVAVVCCTSIIWKYGTYI